MDKLRSTGMTLACCLLGGASAIHAFAQESTVIRPKIDCPASGYYPPQYATIGRNAGDGPGVVDSASPCSPQEVRDAASSIGLGRSFYGTPFSMKGIVTIMFTATGSFAADGVHAQPGSTIDMQVHYGLPAVRLAIKSSKKSEIRVFNDDYGWTEVTEGGLAKPFQAGRRELEVLTKLTPFGALWSVAEAEGKAVVSMVDGKMVLRGTSPYDNIDVTVTLDEKKRPASVTAVDGKNTYGATFHDYVSSFEPDYHFVFPSRMAWTKNGRAYAELKITEYKSNPYVMFPVPANVKGK